MSERDCPSIGSEYFFLPERLFFVAESLMIAIIQTDPSAAAKRRLDLERDPKERDPSAAAALGSARSKRRFAAAVSQIEAPRLSPQSAL